MFFSDAARARPKSSGPKCVDSAVELTRSQNITVNCHRSPSIVAAEVGDERTLQLLNTPFGGPPNRRTRERAGLLTCSPADRRDVPAGTSGAACAAQKAELTRQGVRSLALCLLGSNARRPPFRRDTGERPIEGGHPRFGGARRATEMSAVVSHRPASSAHRYFGHFPYADLGAWVFPSTLLSLLASPTGFEPVLPP
jgi:hypothetical protein